LPAFIERVSEIEEQWSPKEELGFHAFRHAASTLLIDLGASPTTVQAQLGHSDPRITLAAYSHAIEKSQREAVERVARIPMPDDAKSGVTTKHVQ
jgi:integrase